MRYNRAIVEMTLPLLPERSVTVPAESVGCWGLAFSRSLRISFSIRREMPDPRQT
jgi:hypothetical protein